MTLFALGVLALSLPALSSAAQLRSGEVLIQVGNNFTLTSNDMIAHTVFGVIGCEKSTLKAELVKNDGTTVEAIGLNGSTATGCRLNSSPVTWEPKLLRLALSGTGTGILSLEYLEHNGIKCPWQGELAVRYTAGISSFGTGGAMKRTCGSEQLEANFQYSTLHGQPIVAY